MTIAAGDTFYIDPTGGTNVHLWIVLSVYTPDFSYDEYAIIVNITSMKAGADMTCLLKTADEDAHDFVNHDSYAFYGACLEVEVSQLIAAIGQTRKPVCTALLTRLRAGLHQSPHTRRGMKVKVPKP